MTLSNILLSNPSFIFENNIFYQKGRQHKDAFEKNYIDLRKREHRLYSDEVVRSLPDFDGPLSLRKEWVIRKATMNKLIKYFRREESRKLILELGSGNGWLSHQLALSLHAEVLGMDVNETELLQGATLFRGTQNLLFMCADIFTATIRRETFDIILLASSIQYFPHFGKLIDRLLELLTPSGEIHIVDSPIYASRTESQKAKKRSHDYFSALRVPAMAENYFHHTFLELKSFNCRILSNPDSLDSLFKRKILGQPQSFFPWVMIKQR
jgi:SAM-dependent methyltransferase